MHTQVVMQRVLEKINHHDLESLLRGLGYANSVALPRFHLLKRITEYDEYIDKRKPGERDRKKMKVYFDLIKENQGMIERLYANPVYQEEYKAFAAAEKKYKELIQQFQEKEAW